RVAFIVDIRRQAIIQHLMFKAIFQVSTSRAQYLSLLLSRPIPRGKIPAPGALIADIVGLINKLSPDDHAYARNLARIRRIIQHDFQVDLSSSDQASLEYVYRSFRLEGLDIAYRVEGMRGGGWFPTLKELILQPDQNGKLGNFLASKEDYDYVRDMHRRNMIIPAEGDFGRKKVFGSIGDYLRSRGPVVSAFYSSNVEQYLFQGGSFPAFVENVRKLPTNDKSLFIRAVPNQRFIHPARVPGHMITQLLQQIAVFLSDFDQGLYQTYGDMVTSHYIAGEMTSQ